VKLEEVVISTGEENEDVLLDMWALFLKWFKVLLCHGKIKSLTWIRMRKIWCAHFWTLLTSWLLHVCWQQGEAVSLRQGGYAVERTGSWAGETARTQADKEGSLAHEAKQNPKDLCQPHGWVL
jgi:hypothetical protein